MASSILNRAVARYIPEYIIGPLQYETYRIFDRWVAKLVRRGRFDAVIAYENSAQHTFEAARKVGAACILDAASLHRIEADKRYEVDLPCAYKTRVDRRKDIEVSLADCIFTVSDLAAGSYRAHVEPTTCVKAISLGADIDRFRPTQKQLESDSVTFVFVGTATRRKGFDILIESLGQLLEEGLPFKMVVAGVIDESLFIGHSKVAEIVHRAGRIGHDELISILGGAHCLVLPSRFDSFGMVVPEAMACGLPVIVSDMVGAKDLVEEGRNGCIVPAGDVQALTSKMRWFFQNRHAFNQMSLKARAAAEEASWPKYRTRFISAITEVLLNR